MAVLGEVQKSGIEPPHTTDIFSYMLKRQTTIAVASELALYLDTFVAKLPPLDDFVDTDTLNNLLSPDGLMAGGLRRFHFTYLDIEINIRADGTLTLCN